MRKEILQEGVRELLSNPVADAPGAERLVDDSTLTTLDTARSGEHMDVVTISDDYARMHSLRFGMGEGSHISCVTRVPAGPIVIKSSRQEIAIGRNLARKIAVRLTEGAPSC